MKSISSPQEVRQRIFGGALIGIINGLFGGGGGMVAVPVLSGMLGYPQKEAHATAIAVIAPVCAVSAVAYVARGCASAPLIIPAALGNALGGVIGAKLLGRLPTLAVQLCFVAVMLAAGIRMVL